MELDDHRAKPMTKNMDQTQKIIVSNQFVSELVLRNSEFEKGGTMDYTEAMVGTK